MRMIHALCIRLTTPTHNTLFWLLAYRSLGWATTWVDSLAPMAKMRKMSFPTTQQRIAS